MNNHFAIGSPAWVKAQKEFENAIFSRELSFLRNFCMDDAWEITRLTVDSQNVYFDYVIDSGMHITDSRPIPEVIAWLSIQNEAEKIV